MTAHLPKRNSKVRLLPAPRYGVLRHPTKIRVRHLVVRSVDNRQPALTHPKILSDFRNGPMLEKLVVNIRRLNDHGISESTLPQEARKLPQQLRIGNNRLV